MTEETGDTAPEATEAAPATETTDKREPAREIRSEVVDRLKVAGPAIVSAVAESLYKREEDRRIAAVLKTVEEIEALEKEVRNLSNGDIQNFDADGKKLPAVFSKERTDKRREALEKLGKAKGKLNKALIDGDWSKLLGG